MCVRVCSIHAAVAAAVVRNTNVLGDMRFSMNALLDFVANTALLVTLNAADSTCISLHRAPFLSLSAGSNMRGFVGFEEKDSSGTGFHFISTSQ